MTKKRVFTIAGVILGVFVLVVFILALRGPVIGNVFSTTVSSLDASGAAGGRGLAPAPAVEGQALNSTATDPSIGGGGQAALPPPQERLIIRSANLSLEVDDTQAVIDAIGSMAEAMGGFVVNSSTQRVSEGALSGDIAIRVPATRFDEALESIKAEAEEVDSENVFGEDVTDEFVDLQARLGSLKIAEQRLLDIMANAQNTTDLLQAEAQLTIRQSEIESIQGRVQFLEQSAALSSIQVHLRPSVLSQPVNLRWQPLESVRTSFESLGRGLTGIVDAAIFIVIAVVPRLLLIALLAAPFYFVGRAGWRRRRANTQAEE